ncbi:OPT oligopeptide transporter protein-domain-containing protein [Schizophyllum commune]
MAEAKTTALDTSVLPKTGHQDPFRSDDEKSSLKDKEAGVTKVVPSSDEDLARYGDVYEDVRQIDLGDDGKERAVETDFDWAVRLCSLEDDPTQPVWTFRLWFISIGLSCFGAVLSQIFAFRPQTIYVSQLFLQTFGFVLGKICEYVLPGPNHTLPSMRTPDNAFWRFVNHGPYNIKEHTGSLIMSAAAVHGALAIQIFVVDDLFYNRHLNHANAIFTLLGSQLLGYGLGGLMRSFLVYPTCCVYPNVMPTVQMFDVLHRGQDNLLQKKRVRFFWILFIGIFIWEWFPEYIAPTLTGVSIFCLARQKSPWVTRIFGGAAGNEGLGLFSLCFDWQYVGSGGSAYGALFQPIQTQLSSYVGLALCIIIFCACYANNVWNAQRFPFLSQLLFNETGDTYNQSLILNDDYTLNATKLEQEGLPWFAASYVIYKIATSLSLGATVTHMAIWHGKQIWTAIKEATSGEIKDPHYQKMKAYKEVPWWWYAGFLVASIVMSLVTCYTGHSQLPWWAFIVAIIFAAVFLPIIAFLYAVICFVPSTEDIAKMLGSALVPGSPHANMYFAMYAYNSTEQGRSFTRDLKIGQYVKLPPRVTFTMQTIGAVIGALLNYLIMALIIEANRDILLSVQGTNVWSGATYQSYNSDAVSWGALGKHLYSPGSRYGIIPMSILIGLIVPIPFWLLHKKFPKWGLDQVITPMIAVQIGGLSSGINSSIFMTFLLCLVSQYWLRKYHPRWFRKYNFLMSAALDGGTEVMVFVWSFAVGGASGKAIDFPKWALNPAGNPDHCMRLT